MIPQRKRICCASSFFCLAFLPWSALFFVWLYSVVTRPMFCHVEHRASGVAAAEQFPDSYKVEAGEPKIDWGPVSSGWNTACGPVPRNLTEAAQQHAKESGGWNFIEDDSGFKRNVWIDEGNPFRLVKQVYLGPSTLYPIPESMPIWETLAGILTVFIFFTPMGHTKMSGPVMFRYDVCAYFVDPLDPMARARKSLIWPSDGTGSPRVIDISSAFNDSQTIIYDVISLKSDAIRGLARMRIKARDAEGCTPVWSDTRLNFGMPVVVTWLTFFVFFLPWFCFRIGAKLCVAEEDDEEEPWQPQHDLQVELEPAGSFPYTEYLR